MKTQKFYPFLLIHNCKKISLFGCLWLLIFSASAQHVTITPNGITPATSSSYPRLSYDAIIALPNPAVGDIAYDLTFLCLRVFNGTTWNALLQQNNSTGTNAEMSILTSSGGQMVEAVADVALDKNSNIYVTGSFSGTMNFGNISISSQGAFDVFIVKYNKEGIVQWARSAGGIYGDNGTSIAVDDSNNVYVGGFFEGTITFGANGGTATGMEDAFITKYNAAGVNQWVRLIGGTDFERSRGIAVDKNCNVYITGSYRGTVSFGTSTFTSRGGDDIFLVKYNSSGVVQWARDAGGTNSDGGVAIAIDTDENVFLTGNYVETSTFGSFSKTSVGGFDIFIVKYNKNGVPQWVQSAGGIYDDGVTDILVDYTNAIAITGYSRLTCSFGSYTVVSKGSDDIFLAKYTNANGTALWAKGIGGINSEVGSGICADNAGNIFLTGNFNRIVNIDGIVINPSETTDMLVAKFSPEGSIKWLKSAAGLNYANGKSIAVDSNKNIYAVGDFIDGVTDGKTTKTAVNAYDYVLLRLSN